MTDVNDRQELIDGIKQVIASEGMIDIEKIQPDATLESLNLQSIDVVMILSVSKISSVSISRSMVNWPSQGREIIH